MYLARGTTDAELRGATRLAHRAIRIRENRIGPLAIFRRTWEKESMGRQTAVVLYVLALVAVVVGMDILFFRHYFWARLIVNIGIVLVFVAFYLRFLKRP
jgi:hypothetical protein